MKNALFTCITLLFFISISVTAQHKDHDKKENNKPDTEQIKEAQAESDGTEAGKVDTKVVNTICPVSGEDLEDFDKTVVYNGKTYAVCCNKCLKKVKADPEKYISRLSDDGKSLKKS